MVSNIFNLGLKELWGLVRNPMMLLLMIYAFSAQIYTASEAMPETLNRASIAIIDEDRSPLSGRIASTFYPPFFSPPSFIDAAQMDQRMDAGLDTFALDIPPDFERDLLANRYPTIQLNVDATRMTQAFNGSAYIQSIISAEVQEYVARDRAATSLPVEIALRARFNPQLDKGWFGSIMELIEAITMLSIILSGAALIREREHGTLEHLLAMPVTPFEILFSKVLSMSLVVLIASMLSATVVVQGWLDVPLQGSMGLFFLGIALHLFAMTSLGLFLAVTGGSMPQFGLLLIMVLMPLQMLSGGMTPRESMPEIVQFIMLGAPNTHFIMLSQAVLFRGAGLAIVWPQLLALLAIGVALFALSLHRFRKL